MKQGLKATLSVLALAAMAVPGTAAASGSAGPNGAGGVAEVPHSAAAAPKRSVDGLEYAAPGLTPEVRAMMRTQGRLDRLADDIRVTAKRQPAAGRAGLAGLVVDPTRNTVHLYWHGAVPAPVAAVLAAGRSAGMTVDVRSAPYTEAQLTAETDRISRLPIGGTAASPRAMTVTPAPDGTGIAVSLGGLPAGTTAARARQLVPALTSAVPLTVTVDADLLPATRFFDTTPYWGGTLIQRYQNNTYTGHNCSSAFGVAGNNGAATYLLTAAHCGPGQWRSGVLRRPDGSTIQTIYGTTIPGRDLNNDGMAILTEGGSGPGVYFGPSINLDTGSQGAGNGIPVGDAAANHTGDVLCTSGAYSGTICGMQVVGRGAVVINPPENGVGRMPDLINAQTIDIASAGQGDSGGPVFAIRSDDRASARGVIAAIDVGGGHERPCQGWAPAGRRCSNSVWFGDVGAIMNTIGVHILTT